MKYPSEMAQRVRKTAFYQRLLPAATDYFETEHYVFVHGWIPCYQTPPDAIEWNGELHCRPDWCEATRAEWRQARWFNGMECACVSRYGVPKKTTVCGHWHASWGHSRVKKVCSEWGEDAVFLPFCDTGIIAIDACTARSGFVNCIVLEDG